MAVILAALADERPCDDFLDPIPKPTQRSSVAWCVLLILVC